MFSTKLSKVTGFVALALATFGTVGAASARGVKDRGAIVTDGHSEHAVVVGPIEIHAYSQFQGASLYTAPAVTGTDRDCAAPAAKAARSSSLPADRVTTFSVPEGEVACLASAARGNLELLWHAVPRSTAPVLLAKAKR